MTDMMFDIEGLEIGGLGIGGLEISMFDKHTKSAAFRGPVQIMRQTIPNLDMGNISLLAYHGYEGLSSPWKGPGYIEDTFDTKHSIYKHHISKHYMFDMADMKVWKDMKV